MLTDKILEAAQALDVSQGQWSIYELTQYLRNKYGAVAVWEDNQPQFHLYHNYVRSVFQMMDWSEYDVVQNNPYRIFVKRQSTISVAPPTTRNNNSSFLQWTDVLKYLSSHGNRTAKQIQSALKMKGITCADIQTVAQNNGANIQTNPYPSKTIIGL